MLPDEKRMARNYEITQALKIGESEIVRGEDENCEQPYFCAYYESNDLVGQYSGCMVSNDYLEITALFAARVTEQCKKVQAERAAITVPTEIIKQEMCIPDNYKESIFGKVVAINPDNLRSEFRTADRQLYLVTGGFGTSANSRGSACFCVNLYSGKECRWERSDIMGEMKNLPDWAKEREADIRADIEKRKTAPEAAER